MCTVTATQIKQDGAALASAIQNIAIVLAKSDPALGGQLSAAADALLLVTNTWTTGSPVADFNTAATAVEAVLALVPGTSALVPFIAIAVTALDILIANIGGSPAAAMPAQGITLEGVKEMQAKIATFPPNPYRNRVEIKRHHFQSPRDSFKAAWDAQVDAAPDAGIMKIEN